MKGDFFMKKSFGTLPSGEETFLYTISCGKLSAAVTDYGATLVSLLVPDRDGVLADVVLGYDAVRATAQETAPVSAQPWVGTPIGSRAHPSI